MRIPFVDLKAQYKSIKPDIDLAISEVVENAAFIGGEFVNKFIDDFKLAYGAKHVIPCGNGTDSLYVILKMLGVGIGDEVITVANSWISSSETITQTGARVVFADIDPVFYSIDEKEIRTLITDKTKAIVAVHLHGQMCAIEDIKQICDEKNLWLIEDCAQAHFSELNGKYAGKSGIAGSFSFYPGKNLGAYGDAGCIITDDDVLAEKVKMFTNHGALIKHQHQMEGINSRMDGLQAAILSVKLPYLQSWINARIELSRLYNKYLLGIDEIILPKVRPGSRHTFHLFVVRAKNRDGLRKYLSQRGISTGIHYPTALPFLPAYKYLNHSKEDFPIADLYQREVISLPIYPEMTEEMVAYIAKNIGDFYSQK